ncbi:uncharacterized protein LDX57_005690 [Aspergillus melleus]|uniref:uncharacterized protein n=1 Tax=Aspergillus melleus TaxID=138277 RepID=UPI001E8DA464|nr:uncharacterized protein LDX57_005690 [Aspergillus melleus]KAH8427984.1 hypothetical protein LDX57_005690 [Aspergillus melleus]
MAEPVLHEHIQNALRGQEEAVESFMAPLRESIATFQYLRSDAVVDRIDAIASGVYRDIPST